MKFKNLKIKGLALRSAATKGFTMIELLVVIAVIGVLAVAVLSAINPIEQINKGRDTGRRSDAGELLSAVERYYASIGWYPWEITSHPIPTAVAFTPVGTGWVDVGSPTVQVLQKMLDTNEIKSGLKSRLDTLAGTARLNVYFLGTGSSSVYACFIPASKAFQTEAWTRCNTASSWGVDAAALKPLACPAGCTATTPEACYICLP